jgi:hypothetical protein
MRRGLEHDLRGRRRGLGEHLGSADYQKTDRRQLCNRHGRGVLVRLADDLARSNSAPISRASVLSAPVDPEIIGETRWAAIDPQKTSAAYQNGWIVSGEFG